MGPIELTRKDQLFILRILLLVLALICSGGLLAWVISRRAIALLLGAVAFSVAVVWTHERLKVRRKRVVFVGWGASAAVGMVIRYLPGTLLAIGCLVALTGLVVDSGLNHRRIKASP